MKRTIASIIALAALILTPSCASRRDGATSAYAFDIPTKDGVRKVRVQTPKEFEIDSLSFVAPGGESFQVHGLRTTVDKNAVQAAVINQQTQAQVFSSFADIVSKATDAARVAAEGYAKAQGVPIQTTKPATTQPAPQIIQPFYTPTPNLPSGGVVVPNVNITPRQDAP